jgi:hypothetical protein
MGKTIIPIRGTVVVSPNGLAIDNGKTEILCRGLWYTADDYDQMFDEILHGGKKGYIPEDAAEEICLSVEWVG